jgi:hypothetical protein
LTLTHLPQQAWLLACSLGLLVMGLGLFWLAWGRPAGGAGASRPLGSAWLWPLLALAGLAAGVAALMWPTVAAAVAYGCQPGAGVLLLVAVVQWLLHERYRRQVIFLPNFSRGRSGSSLLRAGEARPSGESSTVDAPVHAGGSSEG